MDTPILSLLGKYFKRRRFLASGVVFAGSSFGTLVLPPIFTLLVDAYAIRGAMVVFGGVWLNVVIVGAVVRPIQDPANVEIEGSDMSPSTDSRDGNDNESQRTDPEESGVISKGSCNNINSGLLEIQMRFSTLSLGLQSFGIDPLISSSRRSLHMSVPCMLMAGTPSKLSATLRDITTTNQEGALDPDCADRFKLKTVDRSNSEGAETSGLTATKNAAPERIGHDQDANPDVSMPAAAIHQGFTCWRAVRKVFALSKRTLDVIREYWMFIRSPGLPMLMLTFFLASFAYFNQFFIFPPLAREYGMTKFQGAMLVSVSNITELLSRVVVGLLVDRGKATKPFLIEASFVLSAALALAITFSTDHTLLFVYSAMFGLLGGVFLPLAILLLVELVPMTHVSSASGLFALITGTGISLGPPVLGKYFAEKDII